MPEHIDIPALLAFHRTVFGDLRMEDAGGDGGGGDGGQGGAPAYTPPATQADLDRIVNERLARQRAQYKDYDDLKSKAAKFDELTEAQKTELQKAIDKAASAEQKTAALTERLVRAEVKAIASGEFQDPGDAYAFIGDLNKFLDKNGDPDPAAIEEALKEVLKNKPYLAARAGADAGLGARGGAGRTPPSMDDLIRQRIR